MLAIILIILSAVRTDMTPLLLWLCSVQVLGFALCLAKLESTIPKSTNHEARDSQCYAGTTTAKGRPTGAGTVK